MASRDTGRDAPDAPRDGPEASHPEPACQEAQKWIEAVTGKSFGEKDFRSALENGILLCELLSAIKPGLVKKINRLPTPIAGLDNLSVFLRGCEELGLKGSQLFDPGDLQDTSIRANLKDSDCNRKLKNVLNTVFWLGKAASGCASYSGPTLNLKEFEGLLAQMKVESDDGGDGSQKRSVRDSGYDCWDSERSDSLSPPRHTRDNSLDSLDSFGSRSQHSPSPDVVTRVNSDGRGSDSEADGPNRRPDVRKDDMLARRMPSCDSRSSVPFNQFLPNRSNATSFVPVPRRKPQAEEGEQRSQALKEQTDGKRFHCKAAKTVSWAHESSPDNLNNEAAVGALDEKKLQKLEKAGIKVLPAAVRYSSQAPSEEQEVRSPVPDIILRRENDFLSGHKSVWDSSSDGEGEADVQKVPDVRKDDLASRRAVRGPVSPKVHQFVPAPVCSSKDRERWEGIRRASQQTLQEKEIREEDEDAEQEGGAGGVNAMPNKQTDDLARRRAQSRPLPQRGGPVSFAPASMSQADMQKWERLKMTEPSSNIPLAEKPSTTPPSKCANLEEEKEILNPSVPEAAELHSPSPITPSPTHAHISKEELIENVRAERETKEEPRRKPSWLEDDLPPMMMSRRVAYLSEDTESASMSDIANEDEVGHLPSLSQSRYERMHEQYNNFQEDDDQWQDDLARWKNRRRSASQELIKKEEERKRMEKKMKEDGVEGSKRKSIKTYKEIVEEKERREAELCEAYKKAASPEEAAMVLQRYALRFTISDATLDSLKLPRSNSNVSPESSMVEHKPTKECESPEAPQRPEPEASAAVTEPEAPEESSSTASSVSPAASDDVQQLKLKTPQSKELQGPVSEPQNIDKKPPSIVRETEVTPTAVAPMQLPSVKPTHKLPSPTAPTSRPVPLLTAKPYGQPRNSLNIKMDGLVRVNGDASVSSPPVSPLITPEKENKPMKEEIPTQQSSSTQELHQPSSPPTTSATLPPSQSSSSSSSSSSSGSTISSLFPGRNCVVTTMIVTELTQTLIEPYQEEGLSNGEVKTVVDLHEKPSEEKPSQPSSTATVEYSAPVSDGLEENSHSEQYQKEQEKLKKEWEKAQLEVEEEERRHNEEERKILEETVAPLYPSGLVSQQSDQKTATPTVPPVNNSDSRNGHNPKTGKEDQHVSKLHFLQESLCEGEPLKKQEMWKTASLDRNSQLDQDHFVKRSGSHEAVAGKLSQPPSPSRCVSGKRLCSGCSQPLGKGAAMIIDTLGLFFHMQCFKCGVCQGQLGDTTAGTDVRIRNGLLSCNDCYIASRGRGQPTTL
ncbi:LIM and calponin homology domains-containing protein 1-like isoform X2 [Synchiropus splendidus]|uniref:LIM and calponin homology domains-containing protein 1-like isoform X2 n=1 Tax=Synchiropus splendidus TaxID=270530 RepID=UPI00237D73ED|nr:LIM and calponin homology domains-containing protein 1-like isoform X2 [Synchiropus splendidus]